MPRETLKIMFGGEAGQGLATVGQAMARALVARGWHLVMTQSYHSRIRGGHNTMTLRAGRGPISAPRRGLDLLVALNQESIDLHAGELDKGGLLVADAEMDHQGAPGLALPLAELAPGRAGGIFSLGVACALAGVPEQAATEALAGFFAHLKDDAAEKNRQALQKAFAWAAEQGAGFDPLAPAEPPEKKRLLLQTNQAIAFGAVSAGVKFCSFYPMTPATSIALTMISAADEMGLVVEQAEDEIAAINMAIGASYAGAPALVPTSGGGFALMGEGISLAGMTETPVLLAISQRPGPATGLPTRTEQGDLELAVFSGHGEFGRAVYAPGDPVQAFHLARRAVATAERFQTPAIIFSDQFLADSFRAVDPVDLEPADDFMAPLLAQPGSGGYKRYSLTEDGISPRLAPGMGPDLVVADSDEHTEEGHITEDLSIRVAMADKRMAKAQGMRAEVLPPQFSGDEAPELLLVCWGSARGSVLEAADDLAAQGRKVGVCHFGQVWPLNPEGFAKRMGAAQRVVCVEGNATGQFAHLLRREAGIDPDQMVLRYDGLPITPEYILDRLN